MQWRKLKIDQKVYSDSSGDEYMIGKQFDELFNIYLNSIIGIISVLSTLTCLILYMINPDLLGSLFLIDGLLNGMFMIMVLECGK